MNALLRAVSSETLANGPTSIDAQWRVSKKSRYGDDVWDFTDETNVRLDSVPDARLRIDWGMYASIHQACDVDDHRSASLPWSMLEELKAFAYLYLSTPAAFGRSTKELKPQTVVVIVRSLIRLFSDVQHRYRIATFASSASHWPLHSLADVSLEDIRSVLSSTDRADGQNLRNGLTLLAAPLMSKFLAAGPLKWNAQDVKALDFRYSDTRSDYQRVMPNELFRLLSNSACGDVLSFLSFIGYERQDKSIETFDLQLLKDVTDGRQMFDDYVAIREADRMLSAKHGKKISGAKTLRKHFKLMYGLTPQQFFELCARTQRAAFTVIALYTGARYSDLTTFTDGCLRVFHGMHVMSGTHVKHQALDAETGADLWPAIPVMRDAIACLKQIARFTFNPYLLSSTETVPVGTTPAPLSLSGYTGAINAYLREIDTTSRWSGRRINAHQLRHTLAHQLARADVGLMFIAHQMKHLHTALNALPPDVTMMYGNVGDLAQQRALHSQSAYLEAAKELYDPSKPVAGGGAAAFMERRKAYFEGLAAHGWSVEQVLIELSKQGLPFASVGVGYCGGKRETLLKDGTKELPPCLGSLQCNPAVCHQAVITKTHEPQWQKILEQNRRLAEDPRMAHAKEPLLAAASTAESVLAALNPVLNGGGA